MKVLVASTIPPWKGKQGSLAWLANAEAMIVAENNHDVDFFLALEVDARGLAPYAWLMTRIEMVRKTTRVTVWKFMLDDGAVEFNSGNRLFRICTGRNAAQEYAMVHAYDAILFLDTDILPDPDCISKLLEIDHPVVGGEVKAYCLHGPKVDVPGANVEEHWNTAGFLMVRREVFTNLAWHYNLDTGCTDDPTYQGDAVKLGFGQTWVRHDVEGIHVEPLVPVEQRPEDRTYHR